MPRMMIMISDEALGRLKPLARKRAALGGIDLSRAYRLEAARLLAEKLEEVTHEMDTGTGEGDPTAAGTETAPAGGTGTPPGAEKLAG